jgi:hypothetical protein
MSSIFISYNHRDQAFVRSLTVDLQRLGVEVWLDELECKIGDSLIEAVQRGIASSEYLGVVLSPNSVVSPWVQKEIEAALAEEMKRKRVKILPLLLSDCEVPPFLAGRKHADFRTSTEYPASLQQLAVRLGVQSSQSPPLTASGAEAAINQFAVGRGISIKPLVDATSHFGTAAFKSKLQDGRGVLYCHSSGPRRGRVFYVQKGIGWYYEYELGGSSSVLGLPTSHEEKRDVSGSQISYFEGGYIEWSPKTSVARAVITDFGREKVIGEKKL